MPLYEDPEFLEALQKIFATRADIKAIADYQQKLYASLSELHTSHRSVHDHVRNLTESTTRGRDATDTLVRARDDLERLLRNLEQAHGQTQTEVRQAIRELNLIQQEIRRVPEIEKRLERIERDLLIISRGGQSEERINKDQEDRIRREEQMNREQEERIRREERKNQEQEDRIRKLEGRL